MGGVAEGVGAGGGVDGAAAADPVVPEFAVTDGVWLVWEARKATTMRSTTIAATAPTITFLILCDFFSGGRAVSTGLGSCHHRCRSGFLNDWRCRRLFRRDRLRRSRRLERHPNELPQPVPKAVVGPDKFASRVEVKNLLCRQRQTVDKELPTVVGDLLADVRTGSAERGDDHE